MQGMQLAGIKEIGQCAREAGTKDGVVSAQKGFNQRFDVFRWTKCLLDVPPGCLNAQRPQFCIQPGSQLGPKHTDVPIEDYLFVLGNPLGQGAFGRVVVGQSPRRGGESTSVEVDLQKILSENNLLLTFLVIGFGYGVGKLRLGSIELGSTTGVLLAGLLFGHLGFPDTPGAATLARYGAAAGAGSVAASGLRAWRRRLRGRHPAGTGNGGRTA